MTAGKFCLIEEKVSYNNMYLFLKFRTIGFFAGRVKKMLVLNNTCRDSLTLTY
jgi:hypothetical protein